MPETTSPDLVLLNGVIDTLDPALGRTHALASAGGVVVATGDAAAALAPEAATVLDLDGAYVMPGLMDVHNHHSAAGQADLFECRIPPTAGLDAFLDEVAAWSSALPADAWVVGGQWGSGLLEEISTPEALARLDEATGGRPAMLRDDSLHNRWANSAALAAAGIGPETPHPEGGRILHDGAGRPTGVLFEAAGVLVEKARAAGGGDSVGDLARAAERGIEMLHAYGITGFQDAASSLQLLQALKQLDDAGRLQAWVVTSMAANDFIFGTAPLGEGIIEHRESLRSAHHRPDFIKIFLDGVPPARTGAFLEPYLPEDGVPGCTCGTTTMKPEELEGWLMRTAARGISAKIHCTGDASVRLVLDTVQKVRAAGHGEVRYHIAHGQFVQESDIPRFAELGVTADISPSLWFPGVISEAMKSVLPAEVAEKMQPNRSLLDAGALVAAGSDWPVSVSPNPWEGIYGLVTRKDPTGEFPGTLWAEQAVTLEEAVRIYTVDCARAMGLDDVAGTLAPGKSADFVVLSADPFAIDVEMIPGITAEQTWFAGRQVFSTEAAAAGQPEAAAPAV
ncbi:amidohydrolase [Arthrobacter sp. G119Y2]|uniref:amidohydrolase n=1 Tax=Arthrobacter sp. G119Y2 TaxID=3134965 RepID=UPI00311A3C46